jgi:hypothetical protein
LCGFRFDLNKRTEIAFVIDATEYKIKKPNSSLLDDWQAVSRQEIAGVLLSDTPVRMGRGISEVLDVLTGYSKRILTVFGTFCEFWTVTMLICYRPRPDRFGEPVRSSVLHSV